MCPEEELAIKNAEQNIRKALSDYQAHTSDIIDAIRHASDAFVSRLAKDSYYAKNDLRKLFSKSPAWHPELDAIIINGTRTHEPNPELITNLAWDLLDSKWKEWYFSEQKEKADCLGYIVDFFRETKDLDSESELSYERAFEKLVPGCYHPKKKKSRIFKALCVGLGIADETANSKFQRVFAKIADEMSSKKIDFKLFVSINPAHFLTMSNPKDDYRGDTLTSCHSLNNGEYSYKNGCTGYARDTTSFIVFTVDDPNNLELLNNRKTSRQIFAYRPGSGLLLQSRMYNTAGGTYGAVSETKVYRDLIQRELSDLEDMPNLWKTVNAYGNCEYVSTDPDFGGYQDWIYSDFDCHISFRNDCDKTKVHPLEVGAAGLCFYCAEEHSDGLLCPSCNDEPACACCGNIVDEDSLTVVHDIEGNEIEVCSYCCNEHYCYCQECNEYHHESNSTYIDGIGYVCDDCLAEYYTKCDHCGDWVHNDDTHEVNRDGYTYNVCEFCLGEHYSKCEKCDDYFYDEELVWIYTKDGDGVYLCKECIDESDDIAFCTSCGAYFEKDLACAHCGETASNEREEEVSA